VGKGGQGCAYAIVDARNVVHVLPSAVATALYADPLGALLVLNQELRARWAVAALLPDRNLRVTGWHLFLFLLTHSGDDARPMLTSHFALLWSGDTMRMRGLLKLCSAPRALESGGNEKLWGWSGAAGWCSPQALPLAAAAPFLPNARRTPPEEDPPRLPRKEEDQPQRTNANPSLSPGKLEGLTRTARSSI
jgi:hypothetical protein